MTELSLRLFLSWDIITPAEYLRRMHPEPKWTYEDCIDWEPPNFIGDSEDVQTSS